MKSRIAIIDPVGAKAGMDYYDLLLLKGVKAAGRPVNLYANFSSINNEVETENNFSNIGVSKVEAILSNFIGFIKSLISAKKKKTEWIALHVFRGGLFDLFTFTLTRLMGFKLFAILHDIESLDTYSLPFIRKLVIVHLPSKKMVHNNFSMKILTEKMGTRVINNTTIIPHVNFTELFKSIRRDNNMDEIKKLNTIHPTIPIWRKEGKNIFLFFGQIKKAKGLQIAIEALSKTSSDNVLIIAGKLRDESWLVYDSLISKYNLSDRIVSVIRHITDDERNDLFKISHAILLPYLEIYQSGVLLMAMSYPLTVIASDLPPNLEILENGKNGLTFKAGDPSDLANKMMMLTNDSQLSSRLKLQGLEDIENKCNYLLAGSLLDKFLETNK